jgi:intracellular sulfur oxidation DsrE/DsrF family protein
MKKLIMICLILTSPVILRAQTPDYKVVFDITSKDPAVHQSIIRWLNGISKSDSTARMEVVFYGKSLDMVVKDRSTVADEVKKLAQNKNIAFRVCEVAMKNQNVNASQLLPGVKTVPDGIYEVIAKQKEGWGYIKAAQ